ncbi:hypothetical protein IJ118_03285 [Candidatus Saccharibacteria bacterium]|nr:hypothetical protein [Candidatus Saccharibacteria bacterium]
MRMEKVFRQSEKKLGALIKKHKYDSSDWDMTGMLAIDDLESILDGSVAILSSALRTIGQTSTLRRLSRKNVVDFIKKYKKKLESELQDIAVIPSGCGGYIDNYGVEREKTPEMVIEEENEKIATTLLSIDIMQSKFETKLTGMWQEFILKSTPIVLSILSLIVSIIALCAGGSK